MKLDDELRAFLQQQHIARVTTIGSDGYPHTVPIS
jgi:nitroimidazol reductase NimA-like FMN-containing flavoprotein (pyridoxamine 5'-phosphate oxidase superfamily)